MRYRPGDTQNDRLVRALRTLPKVQIQNTLMRRSDREIALAMLRMEEADRAFALSHIPPAKAQRVMDEISYQRRLRITPDQYDRIVELLLGALNGTTRSPTSRSYVRPRSETRAGRRGRGD